MFASFPTGAPRCVQTFCAVVSRMHDANRCRLLLVGGVERPSDMQGASALWRHTRLADLADGVPAGRAAASVLQPCLAAQPCTCKVLCMHSNGQPQDAAARTVKCGQARASSPLAWRRCEFNGLRDRDPSIGMLNGPPHSRRSSTSPRGASRRERGPTSTAFMRWRGQLRQCWRKGAPYVETSSPATQPSVSSLDAERATRAADEHRLHGRHLIWTRDAAHYGEPHWVSDRAVSSLLAGPPWRLCGRTMVV